MRLNFDGGIASPADCSLTRYLLQVSNEKSAQLPDLLEASSQNRLQDYKRTFVGESR